MKKIVLALALALPVAAFAAGSTQNGSTPVKTAATAPAPAATGKNLTDYKARLAVCQDQAKTITPADKRQKAVAACMRT